MVMISALGNESLKKSPDIISTLSATPDLLTFSRAISPNDEEYHQVGTLLQSGGAGKPDRCFCGSLQ